jgi:hypothetical protein
MNITTSNFAFEAIKELAPKVPFNVTSSGVLNWDTEEVPDVTVEQINAKIAELQADYDAKEYQRTRAEAYPSIGEQLDMIFHAGLGGDEFQAAIQAVKDAYPKP